MKKLTAAYFAVLALATQSHAWGQEMPPVVVAQPSPTPSSIPAFVIGRDVTGIGRLWGGSEVGDRIRNEMVRGGAARGAAPRPAPEMGGSPQFSIPALVILSSELSATEVNEGDTLTYKARVRVEKDGAVESCGGSLYAEEGLNRPIEFAQCTAENVAEKTFVLTLAYKFPKPTPSRTYFVNALTIKQAGSEYPNGVGVYDVSVQVRGNHALRDLGLVHAWTETATGKGEVPAGEGFELRLLLNSQKRLVDGVLYFELEFEDGSLRWNVLELVPNSSFVQTLDRGLLTVRVPLWISVTEKNRIMKARFVQVQAFNRSLQEAMLVLPQKGIEILVLPAKQ